MPTVVQLVQNDGSMRTPTVEDMANVLASQAIQLARHGRIAANANDSFTRSCMAQSNPVAARGFDRSNSGNWLRSKPSTTRIDAELRSLLING